MISHKLSKYSVVLWFGQIAWQNWHVAFLVDILFVYHIIYYVSMWNIDSVWEAKKLNVSGGSANTFESQSFIMTVTNGNYLRNCHLQFLLVWEKKLSLAFSSIKTGCWGETARVTLCNIQNQLSTATTPLKPGCISFV